MIPPSVRIFVCTQPQDMRRSFDGLALATRQVLGENPQSGALFLFGNKRANRVKLLWWDRNGYCLLYKRLHRAKFVLPDGDGKHSSVGIDGQRLATILAGAEKATKRSRPS